MGVDGFQVGVQQFQQVGVAPGIDIVDFEQAVACGFAGHLTYDFQGVAGSDVGVAPVEHSDGDLVEGIEHFQPMVGQYPLFKVAIPAGFFSVLDQPWFDDLPLVFSGQTKPALQVFNEFFCVHLVIAFSFSRTDLPELYCWSVRSLVVGFRGSSALGISWLMFSPAMIRPV